VSTDDVCRSTLLNTERPFVLPGKRDSRGDVLARRDVTAAVRDLYDRMCDLLLERCQLGVSESLALLREELSSIIKGEIPIERLRVTRQMSKPVEEYSKSNTHLPHVEV
jgi:DNA polymerase elongation subunit (family B)